MGWDAVQSPLWRSSLSFMTGMTSSVPQITSGAPGSRPVSAPHVWTVFTLVNDFRVNSANGQESSARRTRDDGSSSLSNKKTAYVTGRPGSRTTFQSPAPFWCCPKEKIIGPVAHYWSQEADGKACCRHPGCKLFSRMAIYHRIDQFQCSSLTNCGTKFPRGLQTNWCELSSINSQKM